MLAAAQERREFAALGLAEFDPVAYIHLCLLAVRGTNERLNRMSCVWRPQKVSRPSKDLRDTACCARAAGASRSGRSLPTIRPHIAGTLFQGLASRVPGQPIFFDTPEANPAAIELAKWHGMEPVFETARMYTKGAPAGRIDRCFGVTTFELG